MVLSIIIVSYNTAALTKQTLVSVIDDLNNSPHLKNSTEIYVVDNNSSDESVSMLRELKKSCQIPLQIIENKDNKGFAAANNQAIPLSKGQYVLLLNSDTIVLGGALEKLVNTFQEKKDENTAQLTSRAALIDHLGIITPTLQNPDGSNQAQGGSLPTLFSLFCHMSMLDDLPFIGQLLPSTQHTGQRAPTLLGQENLTPMEWVGGTAMLIRKEVIDEIGLLDEHIFMYGEDIEFCLRAKNHHWDIALQPMAKIIHLQNKSSSSQNAIRGELLGYLYIWSKHMPLWQLPLAKGTLLFGILLRIILFSILGKLSKAKMYHTIFSAVRHGVA